ncbi:MAG TPA: YetF domain-containing protein [Candidatus Acidoferrales bacterium]|nr:YetF domain-containing protein [Candidatus Acidoferrales bacterium]
MQMWLPEIPVWEKILRSFVVYGFLLVSFRLIGKRQVAQMTPFDLIVLLIISNVLQNAMIGPDNSVLGGMIGATTILGANWVVGYMAFSSRRAERLIEGVPTLLVHHGHIIESNLRREEFSHEDLLSSLRSQGFFDVKDVRAAILEPSGKLSVMGFEGKRGKDNSGGGTA